MRTEDLEGIFDRKDGWYSPVQELAKIIQTFARKLRKYQCLPVRRVAAKIHIGLIAVACILIRWPDWRLAQQFVTGFDVVDRLEPFNVFRGRDKGVPCNLEAF